MRTTFFAALLLAATAATAAAQTPLGLVPITPCRIADTRNPTGAFGGPSIQGLSTRNFNIPASTCSIPSTAQAYSLSVAVVPQTGLGYLTIWPAGQAQPLVSTLNSIDGRTKSNAAIVPAGLNGAISVFASNTTDVVLDIDGYFLPSSNASALAFYPLAPCRVADTRNPVSNLGGPYIAGQQVRAFPILSSACSVPSAAQSYSLNFTAVPHTGLGYLTTWATGQSQPLVSTLNAVTGAVTANAAIVPAGTAGSINVFASNDTDLVIDINGYFAPQGSPGALAFYAVTPCRVLDTRLPAGSLPFSGNLNITVAGSACPAPTNAQSYVFNATVVPPASFSYLTLYAHGATQPLVSTLNAGDGVVASNMAIVPTSDGSVTAFAANTTHLVMDISGYFGPATPISPTAPTITSFSPASGPIGTLVTVNGTNLGTPLITAPQLSGGSIGVPLSTATATAVTFVVPAGEASGNFTITTANGSVTSSVAFTVTPSSTFSVSASPASVSLIQGQSVSMAVTLTSANAFNQLAPLSVSGLPSGVTASFVPASITAGQVSVLTLTAAATQAPVSANLAITASATVDALPVAATAATALAVVAPTTTLLGRTVVSNPTETPLAGVTVTTLGQDGNGASTGCTGHSAVSDSAGNFVLTNLPAQCASLQLISFDGSTATNPAGKYAGVDLVFMLSAGQVTASPVLVHLPRIDNVETFMVTQNAAADQSYSFTSIPGLSLTVYAGTTFTLPDGTKPNPFPLAAVQVPLDRLPDLKANVPPILRVFIVAFQPANTVASQPVAVFYPNVSNTPPGSRMITLMTLDPTRGTMVPYGTGTVSADGTQVVPDADSSHPGHLYGLVHFDWHGQMPPPPSSAIPCPACAAANKAGGPPTAADPVDLSSGLEVLSATDLAIHGTRGSISISRIYRTLSTYNGSFGPGHELGYAWLLSTRYPNTVTSLNLISPDGNQFLFSRQKNGTLTNSSIPWLQGAVMTTSGTGASLRYKDGTVWAFQPLNLVSYLGSMTDRNGNVITLTVVQQNSTTLRISQITDPVGRSLNLSYDANAHLISAIDPLGRKASYTYNPSGTLATMTDPNGGVTQYQYDANNRITAMIDPRNVMMFQNTYDANGRVVKQVRPDHGVFTFSYTLINPLVDVVIGVSPILTTTVTDPLGNQTSYRFNVQGFLTDVTDPAGQAKSMVLDAAANYVRRVSGPAQCRVCGPRGQGDRTYTYDANGNSLTSTDALGNTTSFTYEPVFSRLTSVVDPLNHRWSYTYDGSGNLTSATDPNGNTSKYAYNGNGLLATATDALNNATNIAYDGTGNPVTFTDALGNVSKNTYDAVSRPVSSTDALGRVSKVTFDVLDRVTSVRDGRGSTTQFNYDAVGNLLTVTDPKGNVTTFTYDSLNRLATRTSAVGKSESYQYDLDGNLIQHTDRRGQVSTFQYDALNRLIKELYQDGAVVTRGYDPYSRLTSVNDSVGGLFGFGYDLNGSLISQSEPTGVISYTRDALHRVATRQVLGQSAITYTYDGAGNMMGASEPAAGATYSYDARNFPKSLSRTNGVLTNYAFDPDGRVLSILHSKSGVALNTQTYTYDANGSRIGASNDLAQPLITQSAAATVDAANELLTNGATTYTQDANGNRLTETSASGKVSYVWDGRNRLASITDAIGNITSFKYDSGRNLTEIDKTVAGVTTAQKFVFDSFTNVVSLTDASGLPVSVLTGDSIDSHLASVDSGGNVSFGLTDALGSIDGVTNGAGSLNSSATYEPYGQTASTAPAKFPFGFTGRLPIASNIIYLRSRFLDTVNGHFLSEDPDQLSSNSSSQYNYADNDPISNSDPLGLRPYYSRSVGTFLKRIAGKRLKEGVEDAVKDLAEDESIEESGIVDETADALSCFTGTALPGNLIKATKNGLSALENIGKTAWAVDIFTAAIATGPIGWALAGGFLLYEGVNFVDDSIKFGNSIGNLVNGEEPKCGCRSQ